MKKITFKTILLIALGFFLLYVVFDWDSVREDFARGFKEGQESARTK